MGTVVEMSPRNAVCESCGFKGLCLPHGISSSETEQLSDIVDLGSSLPKKSYIYRAGESFRSIYAVHSGSVKTFTMSRTGDEQITGFHFPGDVIGLDAVHSKSHVCFARTLETTTLCAIPFDDLESLCREIPSLQHQLLRIMSRSLSVEEELLSTLGNKDAEQKLASLLINISLRFRERGYSESEFNLSMSRTDIANYLGLAVETVSRMFTRFHEEGLITINKKSVKINDLESFRVTAGLCCGACGGEPE